MVELIRMLLGLFKSCIRYLRTCDIKIKEEEEEEEGGGHLSIHLFSQSNRWGTHSNFRLGALVFRLNINPCLKRGKKIAIIN